MKKSLPFLVFALFISFAANLNAQCSGGRYHDKIFQVKQTTGVVFGTGTKFDGTVQSLAMDISEPKNDNFARRPLIILAFGGSFTSGLRQSPDLLVLCDEFAKRGYVTATIDYRIGVENDDDTCMYKAVIRGIQDMHAAIRFFANDVATTNTYRIDPSQIFVGGTSAGGFIGLNMTYYKLISSRPSPPELEEILIRLGGMNGGNTGNPSAYAPIKGVINLCGAILDTLWIQPGDPMLLLVHGTEDGTVPYYYDSIAGITDIKSRFFGSGDIDVRCNNIGLNHYLRPFYGADHVPFVLPYTPYLPPAKAYMDTTIEVVRDFLYANVACDSTLISSTDEVHFELPVTLSPNPTDGPVQISSRYTNTLIAEVYNVGGQLLATKVLEPGAYVTFLKQDLGSGMFMVQLTDKINPEIKKIEKLLIY